MKRKLLLAIICLSFILILSCSDNKSNDYLALAEKFEQAQNSHDAEASANLYAEDAVYYLSGEPEPIRGRAAIKKNIEGFFRAFSDFKVEFTHVHVAEGHFIVEATLTGTHDGPMATPEGDIAPTGNKINLEFAFIGQVNADGLVQEDRTYFDTAAMASQLGLQ